MIVGPEGPAFRQADRAETSGIRIGDRTLATRYFLAPLAGYTHLAFRRVVRACGGVGLATTDLVQASHLVAGTRWARELVATHPEDEPLSVQIYGGVAGHLVAAAKWLEDHGYAAVDLNMGCPMAKITGHGGGARLMCDVDGACTLVGQVVEAITIPVTVKMRLGWDCERISAPALAREFEQLGVAAITIHGRTRAQGFRGSVDLDGIRAVVEAVERIPVVGNGDVRSPADAWRMREATGCAAVAIGRGALLDPWIFRRLQHAHTNVGNEPAESCGRERSLEPREFAPSAAEQIGFLSRHFELMVEQHGEFHSCRMFRKFAAWSGARLGIPEDLEDRLRRFESIAEFDDIVKEIRARHGTRRNPRPTAEIKVPNGPLEYW
ncbi:MAG TPA: tRNA-dihydrouridine synthase family protein [Planctomycetaceae bacterium]|nr:tRNA-dihydrouridine synthase family protein [Planctomycetaceae bacterium]